jgi:hypothetical protein
MMELLRGKRKKAKSVPEDLPYRFRGALKESRRAAAHKAEGKTWASEA